MAEVERVDGDAERLQHRPAGVADAVRQAVQEMVRPGHELTHGPVLAAVARELDAGAEIAVAVAAGPAGTARDGRVDRHPLAAPGTVLDHAGGFVAEHQRGRQGRIADLALVPPVQVRAADADRGHPDQARPRPGLRDRLLAQPDIARSVQPRGLHARPVPSWSPRLRPSSVPASVGEREPGSGQEHAAHGGGPAGRERGRSRTRRRRLEPQRQGGAHLHRLHRLLLQPKRDRHVQEDREALGIELHQFGHEPAAQAVPPAPGPVHGQSRLVLPVQRQGALHRRPQPPRNT